MPDIFPLWAFGDTKLVVVTRGRTMEEAWEYAQRHWPQGGKITRFGSMPLDMAKTYGINHSTGWLYRKPVWLSQKT